MKKHFLLLLVLISPFVAQAQQEKLVTRYYPVDPARWTESFSFEAGDPFGEPQKSPRNDELENIFKRYGVDFPEGASFVYEPLIAQLVVVNTPANIEKIEKILSATGPDIRQVYVDVWAVSFLEEALQKQERALGRPLRDKEYLEIWKKGEGNGVYSQGVRTFNGVNAIIQTGKGSNPDQPPHLVLNVTPSVGNHGIINLVMLPAHKLPSSKVNSEKSEELLWELTTSVALMDSDSIVLGHSSDQENSKRIVLFLSARTVKILWKIKD